MINYFSKLSSEQKGIYYMLFASFLFAFMGGFAKHLSQTMSSVEVVFFRNVFGVGIILFSIYKKPLQNSGSRIGLLLFRGFIGFFALLMFFYNVANIPLAEAMTFSKTSPIFTAVLAYFFLKENINYKGWIGVFIGFIGILFITKFDGSGLSKTDYLGILSGFGAGLAYTSIRELKNHYEGRAIVLSFMSVGTFFPIIFMMIGSFYFGSFEAIPSSLDFVIAPFVMPNSEDWIYIVSLGLFSTFAQIYMTKAYSSSKAGIIGTVSYSNIIFSIILGLFIGDNFPDIITIIGILFITISGMLATATNKKN
jgi:drug/metabolite transporter (DMT)-like permease